jgi:DNA modification methylase
MPKTKTPPPEAPPGLAVEVVPIDAVSPDPSNVRRHPERNLDAIKASLRRFGQVKPIVVDPKGIIRAGNGTHAAAQALGWREIAVVRTRLDGVEATAYAIADNRTADLAAWDDAALAATLRALQSDGVDMPSVGFTDDEVDALIEGLGTAMLGGEQAEDPGPEIDRAEELLAKWQVKPGDLWRIGGHRLLCGDSTKPEDVARVMGGERFALIVTDPPYGVDFKRGQFITDPKRIGKGAPASIDGDHRKDEEQRAFIAASFAAWRPHADGPASVYMFAASLKEGCFSYFGMMDAGIHVQSQLIWNKNVHALGQADYHWKHEPCWYGWYEADGPHRWYGERDKFTVLDCARVPATLHPNEKPSALVEDFLENSSLRGDIVAEPFGGSGTTLAACEAKGRLCRAVEIDPKFVAVILERLAGMGLEPERV